MIMHITISLYRFIYKLPEKWSSQKNIFQTEIVFELKIIIYYHRFKL